MIAILNIKDLVLHLTKKYHTANPYELADALNITVFCEELGSLNGYYTKPYRMKQIHINSSLNEHDAAYTCAHELGHAVLHPNVSTPFLRSKTLLSVDKLEIEANTFAINLLVSDEVLSENISYTIEQISRLLGYSQNLIELRLKTFHPEPEKAQLQLYT